MKPGAIEVRHATLDDGTVELDEVVAFEVMSVHLEKMSDQSFALIIETRQRRACFRIGTKRAPVDAIEQWNEPINRRAEAQRRRWAQLTDELRKRRRKK